MFFLLTVLTIRERLAQLYHKLKCMLHDFNLFPSIPPSTDPHELRTQRISTRLFIILLITCVIILLFYLSLINTTKTVHVDTPTLQQYSQIYSSYSQSLTCPCQKISINYEEFISIHYTLHQICSSVFLTDDWFTYLYSPDYTGRFTDDFRFLGPLAFQGISSFCQLVNNTMLNGLKQFYSTQYVSSVVLPMKLFQLQVESVVEQFRLSTTNNFLLSLTLNRNTTQTNAIWSGLNTNHKLYLDGWGTQLISYTMTYEGRSCGQSSEPTTAAGIYFFPNITVLFTVPGFRRGCFIVEALLQSDLRCFYNASCINELEKYLLPQYAINVTALDDSLSSNYLPNSTIQQLLDHLMIEEWNVTHMYDRYYNACQPTECTYNVEARNAVIYVVTTLIGIIGGLTTVLQFIILSSVKLVRKKSRAKEETHKGE